MVIQGAERSYLCSDLGLVLNETFLPHEIKFKMKGLVCQRKYTPPSEFHSGYDTRVNRPLSIPQRGGMRSEQGMGEDPTMNRLEAMAAALLGKDRALFVPSGTMGNIAALMTHCRRGTDLSEELRFIRRSGEYRPWRSGRFRE